MTGLVAVYAQSEASEQNELIRQIISPVEDFVHLIKANDSDVIIVEFGDYQCNHCANFNRNVKDLLISEYVDTGEASFMYKDFPVNDGEDELSTLAAEASYCAAEQGKYWEYHDELFRNTIRDSNQNWVTLENLNEFAINVGVANDAQFQACLNSHKHVQLVKENELLARTLELPSTPSFAITSTNGSAISPNLILMAGEHPHTDFGEAISQLRDMNNNSNNNG